VSNLKEVRVDSEPNPGTALWGSTVSVGQGLVRFTKAFGPDSQVDSQADGFAWTKLDVDGRRRRLSGTLWTDMDCAGRVLTYC